MTEPCYYCGGTSEDMRPYGPDMAFVCIRPECVAKVMESLDD